MGLENKIARIKAVSRWIATLPTTARPSWSSPTVYQIARAARLAVSPSATNAEVRCAIEGNPILRIGWWIEPTHDRVNIRLGALRRYILIPPMNGVRFGRTPPPPPAPIDEPCEVLEEFDAVAAANQTALEIYLNRWGSYFSRAQYQAGLACGIHEFGDT